MDKKSKIFFIIFFTAIFVVTAISFYKFFVLKDYYIKTEIDCDPAAEKCFIYECDPADDSECPENPAERLSYYKLIEKMASAIPLCDPSEADCPPLSCLAGEDCREILCDEAAKAEGEECSDPEEYLKNQGLPDDNSVCAPEDPGCASQENDDSNSENNQENANSENQILDNSETPN